MEEKKKGYFTCSAQTMLPAFTSITRDCMLTPSDKHLTHNTQSRHGGYKMQVTMTIPNWDGWMDILFIDAQP